MTPMIRTERQRDRERRMGKETVGDDTSGRAGRINGGQAVHFHFVLPEGCIANVLSLTSPRDACRLSLVASTFRSAADSDTVWERFLPPDYKDVIARAADSSPPLIVPTKKELFLHLADRPLIIDHGTKSFSLEKQSGRKCYMLAAKDLLIIWSDTPKYWRWISRPESSRFAEVAELVAVCWLEIRGKINTAMLSPNTMYVAYVVFKLTEEAHGLDFQPAEASVGTSGSEPVTRTVFLDPKRGEKRYWHQIIPRRFGMSRLSFTHIQSQQFSSSGASNDHYPKVRGDGWMEAKLGEYFNRDGGDGDLEMSLMAVKGGNWKSGLIVQGIDIRPKKTK